MANSSTRSFITTLSTLFTLAIILTTLGAGCGKSPATSPEKTPSSEKASSGHKPYQNEKGFSLEYPAGWSLQENVNGTTALFLAPPVKGFSANLNVIVNTNPGVTEIAPEQLKTFLKGQVKDFTFLQDQSVTIDGQRAVMIAYTGTLPTINVKGHFTQYLIIKNNQAYILTITRPQDDPKLSEKEFEAMIKSFKILK